MSNRIRVILLESIPDLGSAGDIVSVQEGYARNALFPAGLAALATAKHVARAEHTKKAAQQTQEQELTRLQERAEAIDGTELTVMVRTKNDEDIFGTVTSATIASELRKAKVEIEARDIKLPRKITKLGTYEAVISFGSGVEATIQIVVVPLAPPKE